MNCKYCFAAGGNHGKTGRMSKENMVKTMEFIFNNCFQENLNMVIVGGEPFLDFDIFKSIVRYGRELSEIKSQKIHFATISNGINIDSKVAEYIENEKISLIISLDSNIKEVNDFLRPTRIGISSYQYIVEHSELLIDFDGMNVNVTITPYNLNLSEIAQFLFEKLNAKSIHFAEVSSDVNEMLFTDDQINRLMKEYDKLADIIIEKYKHKEYVRCYPLTALDKIHNGIPVIKPCSALNNRCAFSPDGKIYPCDVLMYEDYCIGNIENGFDEKRIRELEKVNQDDSWCYECWARYLCGGECLSMKLWKNYEQKVLRCKLKRHICKLKLYIYENIAQYIDNEKELKCIFGGK
jgi:uncharacterized protein